MRHSFVLDLLRALGRIPGAIWCYCFHSWYAWIKLGPSADYDHLCLHCDRTWKYRHSFAMSKGGL